METLTFNTTEQALLAAVGILFLIQLLYYFVFIIVYMPVAVP